MLREFEVEEGGDGGEDVPDPIGMGMRAYVECREAIQRSLQFVLEFLKTDIPNSMSNSTTIGAESSQPLNHPQRTLRIALGADHGGVGLKTAVHGHLTKKGYMVTDAGTFTEESVDYPDLAEAVCRDVLSGGSGFWDFVLSEWGGDEYGGESISADSGGFDWECFGCGVDAAA